jgi:hypothetical protein
MDIWVCAARTTAIRKNFVGTVGNANAVTKKPVTRVKSPVSGRLIVVGGPAYQKMLSEGYVLTDNKLVHRDDLEKLKVRRECMRLNTSPVQIINSNHIHGAPAPPHMRMLTGSCAQKAMHKRKVQGGIPRFPPHGIRP